MADLIILISLAFFSSIILLFAILFFANRIWWCTTVHQQIYRRKDYFSVQHQLLISNQQYLFCKYCKNIPKRLISCSLQTEPIAKFLTQTSQNSSVPQISSLDNENSKKKMLSQHSYNISTEDSKCLQKNYYAY